MLTSPVSSPRARSLAADSDGSYLPVGAGADLTSASLEEAGLDGALLSGAVLQSAYLTGSVADAKDITGADFSEAVMPTYTQKVTNTARIPTREVARTVGRSSRRTCPNASGALRAAGRQRDQRKDWHRHSRLAHVPLRHRPEAGFVGEPHPIDGRRSVGGARGGGRR